MEIQNDIQENSAGIGKMNEQFTSDLAQYSGNWIWRALECLIESPDFEYSPKWAAKRLNVTVEKIVDAYEGLDRLGYIKREGVSYKKNIQEYHIGQTEFTREDLLAIHSRLAPQVISKLKPTSKFTTWFFLGNDELVTKYAPQFMKIYAQMHKEGLEKGLKEVVASEISFAILSDDSETGGQQ